MDAHTPSLPEKIAFCSRADISSFPTVSGLQITKDLINNRVCYTLDLSQVFPRELREISESWIEAYIVDILKEEAIRNGASGLNERGIQTIRDALRYTIQAGWTRDAIEQLVHTLHHEYGAKFRDKEAYLRNRVEEVRSAYVILLSEYRKIRSTLSTEDARQLSHDFIIAYMHRIKNGGGKSVNLSLGENTQLFLEEVRKMQSDPRYRRVAFQESIGALFGGIEKQIGGTIGLVSTGGGEKADAGVVLHTGKREGIPRILLSGKGYFTSGESLKEVLDRKSITSSRPVFTHYLLSPDGTIIGEVITPLSQWMERVAFPTKERLIAWIRDPKTLPPGGEIRIRGGGAHREVSITKMTPQGYFISLGIQESAFMGMIASGEYFTIGYIERSGDLIGNIALSGSRTHLKNPENREDATTQSGVGVDGNWQGSLYKDTSWELGTRGNFGLHIQTGSPGIEYTQTARVKVQTEYFLSYQIGPGLSVEFGYGYDRLWSPNLSPNTFYKLPLSERNLGHFQKEGQFHIGGSYTSKIGKVETRYEKQSGRIMDHILLRVGYTLGNISLYYENEKNDPAHPLVTGHRRETLEVSTQGREGGASITLDDRRNGEKREKKISLMGNIRF